MKIPPWLEDSRHVAAEIVSPPGGVWARSVQLGLALIAVQEDDTAAAPDFYQAWRKQRARMDTWCRVSLDRVLGLLAQTMGNLGDAAGHFDEALAFCRKAGYRPELAWTCCDYADMLRDPSTSSGRAAEENQARATALLDESLAISRELGMRPLMERVLSRREILGA